MVMRDWVDVRFAPLLKLRNTVGYWKPRMRTWCQLFARDRGAALAFAFLFVDGTSRQIADPTPIYVDGARVDVQRAMYDGNHKYACTSVSARAQRGGGGDTAESIARSGRHASPSTGCASTCTAPSSAARMIRRCGRAAACQRL